VRVEPASGAGQIRDVVSAKTGQLFFCPPECVGLERFGLVGADEEARFAGVDRGGRHLVGGGQVVVRCDDRRPCARDGPARVVLEREVNGDARARGQVGRRGPSNRGCCARFAECQRRRVSATHLHGHSGGVHGEGPGILDLHRNADGVGAGLGDQRFVCRNCRQNDVVDVRVLIGVARAAAEDQAARARVEVNQQIVHDRAALPPHRQVLVLGQLNLERLPAEDCPVVRSRGALGAGLKGSVIGAHAVERGQGHLSHDLVVHSDAQTDHVVDWTGIDVRWPSDAAAVPGVEADGQASDRAFLGQTRHRAADRTGLAGRA